MLDEKRCAPCILYFFEIYSQALGFFFFCVMECGRFWSTGLEYLDYFGADNLEGLPKCVVRLFDVCKLVLSYLISSFCDMFADKI